MHTLSANTLYRPPESLSPEWAEVFQTITEPVIVIGRLRQWRDLRHISESALDDFRLAATTAWKSFRELLRRLDGLTPRTWQVGCEIDTAMLPVLSLLRDSELLSRAPSHPVDYRRCLLDSIRAELSQACSNFPWQKLLIKLRYAVATERSVELTSQQMRKTPIWDSRARQLHYRGKLCKRFRRPARDQETILAAFQEEGWPPAIDAPLTERKLPRTVESLNKRLNHLRFSRNGTTAGVCWEPGPITGASQVER